jgi:hypothetical protein
VVLRGAAWCCVVLGVAVVCVVWCVTLRVRVERCFLLALFGDVEFC